MKTKKFLKGMLLAFMMALVVSVVMPEIAFQTNNVSVVQAASVKLNKKKATLIKGKTLKLKITGTSNKVTWKSSNKKVATVNSSGKVTAKKKGTATITAKVNGKSYKCKITVETPKISNSYVSMEVGDTYKLSMSGTSQKVTWKSNKKTVATVNSSGKVTAKKAGTATITAKVGGKSYKCTIIVKDKVKKYIEIAETKLYLEVGQSKEIAISSNCSSLTKSDKNYSIARSEWGNGYTLVITAKSVGTATIEVKGTYNTSIKETITVIVTQPVTSVSLDKTSLTLFKGECSKLSAKVLPYNASDRSLIWNTSDTNVATVDDDGNVNAIGKGQCVISVISNNGIAATCNVIVEDMTLIFKTELPKIFGYKKFSGGYYTTTYAESCTAVFERKSFTGEICLNLEIPAEKKYDWKGTSGDSTCYVAYKLYNSQGIVVDTGELYQMGVSVGDKFILKTTISGLEIGDYYIEFLDN